MSGDLILNEVAAGSVNKASNAIEVNKAVLSDFKGMVCLTFEKRTDCLTLTKAEAMQMAEALARQTYRAAHGDFPTTQDRSQITEQLRIRARNRVRQMLQRFAPKTQAEEVQKASAIVDEIMKIFL